MNAMKILVDQLGHYLKQNEYNIQSYGLMHGKMGLVIFFYHLGKYSGKMEFSDYASELLDQILQRINPNMTIDFENGIAGIGWGIEYLIQNNFVEGDADEILEELDTLIGNQLIFGCEDPIVVKSIGYYYISRLQYRVDDDENDVVLELKYFVILLIDELERQIEYMADDPELGYLLNELYKLNIFNYKILKLKQKNRGSEHLFLLPGILKSSETEMMHIENLISSSEIKSFIDQLARDNKWGLKNGIAGMGLQIILMQ